MIKNVIAVLFYFQFVESGFIPPNKMNFLSNMELGSESNQVDHDYLLQYSKRYIPSVEDFGNSYFYDW